MVAKRVGALLCVLWASGLIIIYIDAGFEAAEILNNTELVFKIICVSILTLNGIFLHAKAFPIVIGNKLLDRGSVLTVAITGAVSTSHWLLAVFVGLTTEIRRIHSDVLFGYYLI